MELKQQSRPCFAVTGKSQDWPLSLCEVGLASVGPAPPLQGPSHVTLHGVLRSCAGDVVLSIQMAFLHHPENRQTSELSG